MEGHNVVINPNNIINNLSMMVALIYLVHTLHDQSTFISLEVCMIALIAIIDASTMPHLFPIMNTLCTLPEIDEAKKVLSHP